MIVKHNLLFEFLLFINAELAVDGDLGSVLGSAHVILLDILLPIFCLSLFALTIILSVFISFSFFIFTFLLVILSIALLLSVVVTVCIRLT